MKRPLPLLCIALCLLLPGCATLIAHLPGARAKPTAPPPDGYVLGNTRVAFVFEPARYDSVTADSTGQRAALAGLRVRSVNVVGDFNGWSRTAWLMSRTDRGVSMRFRLEHTLADVGTGREYAFRFLVNDRWWVEPRADAWNRRAAADGRAGWDFMLELE